MKKKYLLTILFIFLLRALDLYLTYLYIPDLDNEYNPIVSIFMSVFANLNNLLLMANISWYNRFVMENYPIFFPSVFVVITFGSAFLFFIKEYSKYLQEQNNS